MADRYAVATGNWNSTATWSATSGGAPGASVPTLNDNVFFNASSGAITVTVSTISDCKNFDCTGFTGTFAGTFGLTAWGNVVTFSSSMTYTHSSELALSFGGAVTLTTNGKTITSSLNLRTPGVVLALNAALTTTSSIIITYGTFTTNNFNVTATQLSSSNSNTRTINLGSSTVTLTSNSGWGCSTSTNLTVNAATSSIILSATSPGFDGGSRTYNDVSFTSTALASPVIGGGNTFNNLSFAGRTTAGIAQLAIFSNQTINGTLTLSAGTNATMRTFVRSNTLGTTRTLTCAAVASLTDIDFRDITIAGAAAPVSGTRLGDCKGNSGITFGAAKTVYKVGGAAWSSTNWATSSGGTFNASNFPLAQDTAVIDNFYPPSGSTITIDAAYNIGTINMSARTSNTMTLATSTNTPTIYGNWINGTGTTLTGSGNLTFAGRGSQTITSAGKTFTQSLRVETPGGSVTLQDAFTTNRSSAAALVIWNGSFDANNYNVSLTGISGGVNSDSGLTRSINFGSGTWTISGTSIDFNPATNLTVTGTGTINLTSASSKIFDSGGIQTWPTINQGGTGTLTISGSNKFAGITNTAIGRIQFTGGTTNEFTSFTLSGSAGTPLQLGSTNTTQAILIKPTSWQMGLLSTDAGNNTGLTFLSNDGTMEYLSVSYINGQISTPPVTSYLGNFFAFF